MLHLISDPEYRTLSYLEGVFRAGGRAVSSPLAFSEFESAGRKFLKSSEDFEQRMLLIRQLMETWISNAPDDLQNAFELQGVYGCSFSAASQIALMNREAIRKVVSLNPVYDSVSGLVRIPR